MVFMKSIFRKKIVIAVVIITAVFALSFAYKTGRTITVIGLGTSSFWEATAALFPKIPDKEEDRIDIIIVGIRGLSTDEEENGNGDFLADTIIIASFNKENNKAAIVSIPRDLYVYIPEHGREKINAAYAIGEERYYGGGGLALMKVLLSAITGVYIDYAVSIDFDGFRRIIDDLGGVVIYRDTPFVESKQWIRDGREGGRYWRLEEGGWTFYVPEGANVMNSDEALYYARSRYSSSDFDRMGRQHEVISAIKSKALNLGMLANPIKIFNILDTLENNVRTDISIADIKELVSLAQAAKIQELKKEVITSGEEGILTSDNIDGRFVLLFKSEDYSEIRALFRNIVE